MKIINRKEQEKIFDKFWDEIQKEFFKVEVLQYYKEDDNPSLREWLKGNKEKSIKLLKKSAKSLTWGKGKEGIKKTRIHIVDIPFSPYIQWEVEFYKHLNIPLVGEEVYLIESDRTRSLPIPKGDTMIFDESKVISNIYDKDGFMIKAKINEDKKEIKPFLDLKKKLLALPLEKIDN